MLDKVKHCKILHSIMTLKRPNSFLCVFNLRQGTIIIAIHQIAVASFLLLVHLVGISHLGEMLSMLHNDMVDDAERRRMAEVFLGQKVTFPDVEGISSKNQKQFAKAQHLAAETVIILYTSTVLTFIYGLCSISLMVGAVRSVRAYVLPWIVVCSLTTAFFMAVLISGAAYDCVVDSIGGKHIYYVTCVGFLATSLYSIGTVCSFALEKNICECTGNDERGEQLLLLDQAAQSSLLSVKQLDKLSLNPTTHFV